VTACSSPVFHSGGTEHYLVQAARLAAGRPQHRPVHRREGEFPNWSIRNYRGVVGSRLLAEASTRIAGGAEGRRHQPGYRGVAVRRLEWSEFYNAPYFDATAPESGTTDS